MDPVALPMPQPVARMAVLWSHLSGYLNASLRECARRDVELLVSWFRAAAEAPFAAEQFAWLRADGRGFEWNGTDAIDGAVLAARIADFAPQMLLVSGWNHAGYRLVARRMAGKTTRILCMDNPWEEGARQWLGRAVAPWYVRPLFDGALVAGERQYQFARRLGFSDGEILTGLYAPDSEQFAGPAAGERRGGFLFVGRLAPEKGLHTLVEAYGMYRRASPAPWPLTVAGTGPLAAMVSGIDGIAPVGFVQPDALPALLLRHACMVVPSYREPWGVQISEGASAGLALVATGVCGATPHLLREGFNGHIVPARDARALAQAMLRIEAHPRLEQLGANSRALAAQFTPRIWADNLLAWPLRSGPARRPAAPAVQRPSAA
jgi:glycosyltransferase involved in cell wall biosynthesis